MGSSSFCAPPKLSLTVTKLSPAAGGAGLGVPCLSLPSHTSPALSLRHPPPLPGENGTEVSVPKGNLAAVPTATGALWLWCVFGVVCVLCFNVYETSGPSQMSELREEVQDGGAK